jgi:hypothetical protein
VRNNQANNIVTTLVQVSHLGSQPAPRLPSPPLRMLSMPDADDELADLVMDGPMEALGAFAGRPAPGPPRLKKSLPPASAATQFIS